MSIFRNVVFIAAIAGLFAGLTMAAMQAFSTTPLIIAAEAYEGGGAVVDHSHAEGAAVEPHSHGEEAWAPADGFERQFYTAAANIVTAIGFALILVAVSEAFGGIGSWRAGVVWGFAGFAVFTLAPGLGLPPELPGMPAAELAARQTWWVATVAATAIGLGLIAFRKSALFAVLGVALIVAPHLVGAPQPASHDSAVPADLHHDFVVAATVTSLIFWVVLGAAVGVVRQRFAAPLAAPQGTVA